MVEEYLSDREQEEALRTWWRDNWSWVGSGIALGLVLLGAWQYWQWKSETRATAAAQTYRDFTTALTNPNNGQKDQAQKDQVDILVKELDTKHAASPYADQAHLLLAQSKVKAGQFDQAANELKSVIEKSEDDALVQVARLRLARLHIQTGHPDEALALLDVNKAGAFTAQVHDIRGDALFAKGDRSGARLEYQAALNEGADSPTSTSLVDKEFVRLKLQDLGDAKDNSVAASPTSPK